MPKIKNIIKRADKPILFNFENGKLYVDQADDLQFGLFTDRIANKKVLGVANGNMVYSGEINKDELFDNFLVVSRKNGHELDLIQVDTCVLTPLLRDSVITQSPLKEQSIADLNKQFGSKKTKRATEQRERLRMNIENVKETLEKTVTDIDIVDMSAPPVDEGVSHYKPKINREASNKNDVYPLSDLVPAKVLDSLQDRVNEIIQADSYDTFELLPIVERNIRALKESLSEEHLSARYKILLYVNYLLNFMNTPMRKILKKYTACDCSAEVDKYIKQSFMINGLRPLSMKEKCLCYVIVLFMLALDYEMDLESLSADTKTSLKRIKEFARNLGFSQSAKSKSSIILKIPVPPPIAPNLKRKRHSV